MLSESSEKAREVLTREVKNTSELVATEELGFAQIYKK